MISLIKATFKRALLVISLFAKSTPSVFSVDQMTSLEPYLKGASDKDDQEIAYIVVVIYRTLLALTQLTFQPEFLARIMTAIATSMTSASLKVFLLLIILSVASKGECSCCLTYCRDVE